MDRDFTCRICARPYNCNAKVLEHIKNTHDDVYKPCKHCLKVFNDDKELEEHLREHLLKDANQCSICQDVSFFCLFGCCDGKRKHALVCRFLKV